MQQVKPVARPDRIGNRAPEQGDSSTVAPANELPYIIGPVCHIGEDVLDALDDNKGILDRILARFANSIRRHVD